MHDLGKYIVFETASLDEAMKQIDVTASGFCFVVNDDYRLIGTLTDGDIRRAILEFRTKDVTVDVCCNREFEFGLVSDKYENLVKRLNDKIKFLPILDVDQKLVSFIGNSNNNFIPILEPKLGAEELKNVIDCVESGWISSNGKYVETFETKFGELHSRRSAVAVSNGTVALHLFGHARYRSGR